MDHVEYSPNEKIYYNYITHCDINEEYINHLLVMEFTNIYLNYIVKMQLHL